jgi:hypothetical protein
MAAITIRPAIPADGETFLTLVDALADSEKLGARRMTEWYTYRLDADQLRRVAG